MRGTLHTVPSSDARWVLRLLAPRILAATSRRYYQLGLDDGLRERADRLVRHVLAAHGPLTRAELTEHLAAVGVQPEGQAPFHLIRHAALTGVLCHGPRRGDEATYVLLDDWLPTVAGDLLWEEDTAVAELARHYLRAHAPVGVEDIRKDLIIQTGKNRGQNPSLASVYRALAGTRRRAPTPRRWSRRTPTSRRSGRCCSLTDRAAGRGG
jgi:hypothetical protein